MPRSDQPPARFVILEGIFARLLGRKKGHCPYAEGPARRVWLYAFESRSRRNRPRETTRLKPGRGRSALGEPRREWCGAELDLLAYAGEALTSEELGAMLGRSGQAVRIKLSQLRKAKREAVAA